MMFPPSAPHKNRLHNGSTQKMKNDFTSDNLKNKDFKN